MIIEATTTQTVSPTQSQVHMVLGDARGVGKATFHLDFDAVVSHAENPRVSEVQITALRLLIDHAESEIKQLS